LSGSTIRQLGLTAPVLSRRAIPSARTHASGIKKEILGVQKWNRENKANNKKQYFVHLSISLIRVLSLEHKR
jgi:hypothetical protein